jgi:hypothetical protein
VTITEDPIERRLKERHAALVAEVATALAEGDEARSKLAELTAPLAPLLGSDLLREGGPWLGAARSWLRRHKCNGSSVTWGSDEELRPPFTVREIEELAADVAAAAMVGHRTTAEFKQSTLARWKADAERDEARRQMAEQKERAEAAERGAAALRASLFALLARVGRGYMAQDEVAEADAALASDAGRGYLSPADAATVREALQALLDDVACGCTICLNHGPPLEAAIALLGGK